MRAICKILVSIASVLGGMSSVSAYEVGTPHSRGAQ